MMFYESRRNVSFRSTSDTISKIQALQSPISWESNWTLQKKLLLDIENVDSERNKSIKRKMMGLIWSRRLGIIRPGRGLGLWCHWKELLVRLCISSLYGALSHTPSPSPYLPCFPISLWQKLLVKVLPASRPTRRIVSYSIVWGLKCSNIISFHPFTPHILQIESFTESELLRMKPSYWAVLTNLS